MEEAEEASAKHFDTPRPNDTARVNTGQVPAPGETQGRDWELRTHNLDTVLVKVTGDLEED